MRAGEASVGNGRSEFRKRLERTTPEPDPPQSPPERREDQRRSPGLNLERPPGDAPKWYQRRQVRYLAAALIVVLLIAGLIWWLYARRYEGTTDAYVDVHLVHVAPRVPGQVARVLVNDNQLVRAGQLLVEIDPADYRAKLSQLVAQKAQAVTQFSQAQAQVATSQAAWQQAVADTQGAAAQAINSRQDLVRYQELKKALPTAVAQEQLDQAVATARNAIAQQTSDEKKVQGALSQITASRAQVSGAVAAIKALDAQIVSAQLDLSYTRVIAPMDGHIANRSVETGNYVQAGQELLDIVPLGLWVTANFKETQLEHMAPGQPATVGIDACGRSYEAHVNSIQRGAGQAFGVLPPENATGNWVKVVQRVPVKVVFDRMPTDCLLGPGMSAEVSVKVR